MKKTASLITTLTILVVMLGIAIMQPTYATDNDEVIVEYLNEPIEEIEETTIVETKAYELTEEEFDMACKIVQTEAGSESYKGKLAVAQTIKDRMITREQSALRVMTAKNQYCCYNVTPNGDSIKAVEECFYDNVNAVDGVCITHFYAYELISAPNWATDDCYVCTIGGHKFYSRG